MTELYIATGNAFAHLTQSKGEWRVRKALEGMGVQCITVDPQNKDIIYVGTYGQGIWKSVDRGLNWENMNLPQAGVFSVAISPADGTVYAGCEPSMLFRSGDGGQSWQELSALRALPSAPSWSFPPRPSTSHIRWIAPNPKNANLLIVGIEQGGIMYSDDGGQTWADHRPNAQKDVHALAWHPKDASRAYEAGGGGAAWSSDGGWSWQRTDQGRTQHYTWALAVDQQEPDCWYISTSRNAYYGHSGYYRGTHQANATIYRWQDQGPWEALRNGLPYPLDSMPYALATTKHELYAALSDGSIYVSPNKGDMWQQLPLAGHPLPSIVALVAVE